MIDHHNPSPESEYEIPRYIRADHNVRVYAFGGVCLGTLPYDDAMKLLHDEIKRREAEWIAARSKQQ